MSSSRSRIEDYVEDITHFQKLKNSFTYDEEVQAVTNVIQANFRGCDMVLTLFIAALNSYRSDRCLRPFPPNFTTQYDSNDAFALRKLCDNIPPLEEFISKPWSYSKDLLGLFSWLFIEKGFPLLELIPFNNDLLPGYLPDSSKPQYMYQVHYHCKIDTIFQARKGNKDLILAYHGSCIDNFYSILKVGLQQSFSLEKETLFGKGIYLSKEASISAYYSPYGQTWKNSSLGTKHSVIAVCEIINDINKVKCKDSENKSRSLNEDSTGEIPDKYFVVTDSDMVRLKYLLVYSKIESTRKSIWKNNLFWVILGLYFFMLIFIGSNGTPWKRYVKYLIDM